MPKPGKKKGNKADPPKEAKEEPAPVPVEMEVDVEEDEGLGIGSKRKQKKEKKQKQELARLAATTSSVTVSREQSEAPEEPPREEVVVDEPRVEVVSEEFGGLGIGGPKKKRPKKKKGDGGTGDGASVASTSSAVPSQSGTVPSQSGTVPSQFPPVPLQSTPIPPQFAATPTQYAAQIPSSSTFPPRGFGSHSAPPPQQPGPPMGSWGRGRGRGQGPIPVPGHSPVSDQPSPLPASQPTPRIAQQLPTQSFRAASSASTSQITQRPDSSQYSAPTGRYSQQNIPCRYKIPNKVPGRTVGGRNIMILTNYLEMTFKSLQISRYDVSFSPDRPKKMIPEVFKRVKNKFYPKELLAFDQTKNCYSLRPLHNVPPNERFNTTVELQDSNGRMMKFEVSFKATGVVDLGKIKTYMSERGSSVLHPTEEVQCIDVILRQGTLESYVKAGRQFFKRPYDPIELGHGYEMWTGLFQSAIFTSKAFVNIDVAHKGFPIHQPLIDAMVKDFRIDPHTSIERQRCYDLEYFLHFIKGLKVVATLVGSSPTAGQKREYICNGLVDPPGKLKFLLNQPDGKSREITVGEYFAKEKKYNIKYPHLNCMWVGPKEKSIYFPIELLEVAYGQPLAKQLDDTQVSKMVREAATPPDKRLKKITEVISSMKYSTNPDFKKFGLEISDKFYQVNARILEPPSLEIGHGCTVAPRKGTWQANQLLKPEALNSWGFIAIETSPSNDYEGVISLLVSTGRQMGMNISSPALRKYDVSFKSLNNILRTALDNGIKFLFVVVSARGRDHYHKLKQMAEREVGMLTQCVREATTRRMNIMTAKNILLKVNSKLMGINQALGEKTMPRCLRDGGVMIVGADVTHPSPDQSNVPSIAAVTASIDPKCYMYNIELSVQTPKKEMIVEFEDMMFDHLKVYKERNMNQLPRKIFVFRDGVSEGQFVQVMNSELAAVHAAYQRMAGHSKKPEILFLLVQKRHHTRFFNRGESMQYNVEPGTVVDTDIVHSSELDFYLVSHQALKGTARPTRYHAVCNDGKIPDDEVEQLTYYLCHLYSRCMRSVSYPTPTYYAHLACLRARSLTHGQKFNNKELERKPERLHVLDKMLQYSRMFFV